MMPFSTRTGLERVGIDGQELELSLGRSVGSGRWNPLQKQETKRIGGGSPVAAPMPKSVPAFAEESNVKSQQTGPATVPVPAQRFQHAPTQFQLKKASSVSFVCGNNSSFTNKADLSTTDGVNSEHKQEQRQSSKEARPARRHGQPTSQRRVSDCAGQHGQGRGAPCRQPTLVERVRTTHRANTTPSGA